MNESAERIPSILNHPTQLLWVVYIFVRELIDPRLDDLSELYYTNVAPLPFLRARPNSSIVLQEVVELFLVRYEAKKTVREESSRPAPYEEPATVRPCL